MARRQGYHYSCRRLFNFALTVGIFSTCAVGNPAGRDFGKVRSTTSDPGLYDAASDDAGLQWNGLDGFDLDGNPWLGLSSPSSNSWKSPKPQAVSHSDDDYDYDDYDGDNLIDEDDAGEKGSQFLSIPRRDFPVNEASKNDDEAEDDEDENGNNSDETSKLKYGAHALPGFSDDFSKDDDKAVIKTRAFHPVEVVEDEDEEEDLILESDDNDQVPEKKKFPHQSDTEGDDEQELGEPEMEGMDTIYDDHAFLF